MNNGDKFEDIKKVFYVDNNKAIIKDAKEALKELDKTGYNEYKGYSRKDIEWELKKAQDELDLVNSLKKEDFAKSHLYDVDIPDPKKADTPTGSNYWEEDGNITTKQFQKIADKLKEQYPYQYDNPSGWYDGYLFSQFLNFRQGAFSEKMSGKEIYNMISEIVGSDKEASKFLESLGYDGIHYFGGRDGEAYVIFNDNALDITNHEKYQKYGTAKANEKNISAEEGLNLKDFRNNRTVQEIADQYGVSTNIVDRILTPEGQRALGVYQNGGIELAKTIKESTAPHELLHATFDLVDNSRKSEILNNIQKRLKVDEIQAEEWLADNFSEYYRTGKFDTKAIPTTLVGKIKQFFQQVKEFVDGTYAERKQIQNLFDDILEGKDLEGGKGSKSVFQSAGDIYSNNFKNWFGDWENDAKYASKVVDKNGDPLVVYHGTPENFTEFKKDMIGANYGQDNQGFFFTDDKAVAQDYADTTSYGIPRSEKGNVMEVYLDIKNPLIKKVDFDPIDLWDNNYEKFLNEANKNGNDGIIIKADKGQSMYVPFEPEQIKSATDNVGTFDKNNPDIRYQFDTYSNENRSKVDNFWGVKEDNGVKYIESAGKPIYNKKKDGVKQRTWDQHQFTNNYIFSIPNELNGQLTKLSNFIRGNDEGVQLGNHYLSRDVINHIYENHGPFALENLIMTLNKYDDIVKRPKGHEDVNYLLKKIPGSNNFFRATIGKNGVVTFFERVSGGEDLYSKDLAKGQ